MQDDRQAQQPEARAAAPRAHAEAADLRAALAGDPRGAVAADLRSALAGDPRSAGAADPRGAVPADLRSAPAGERARVPADLRIPTPPARPEITADPRTGTPRARPGIAATTGQLPVARTTAIGPGPTGTAPLPVIRTAPPSPRPPSADPRLRGPAGSEPVRGTRTRRAPVDPAVRPFTEFAPPPAPRRAGGGARGLVSFLAVVGLALVCGLPAFATGALAAPRGASAADVSDGDVQHLRVGTDVGPDPVSVDAVAGAVSVSAATGWIRPVDGRIGDPFGPRPDQPVPGVSLFHRGQDLVAPCGTTVHAAAAGVVTSAGWWGTYGNWILIDHGHGIATGYAHEEQVLVSVGQHVHEGQAIGLVGETGAATGCHLHLEVHLQGVAVNPVPFFIAKHAPLG